MPEPDPLKISEYTTSELRNQANQTQIKYLKRYRQHWLAELSALKRRSETQMTSSNTRKFRLYCEHAAGKISEPEYNDQLLEEKVWRINAVRFIQQVETRLAAVKLDAEDS